MSATDLYRKRGIRTVINAKGPATRLSGGVMRPEVVAAMSEAALHCVDMAELEAHASQVIADVTGAEAGYVASGAAACLLLAAAACVAGLDLGLMARLPEITGARNEIIVARSQRNLYDHAVRTAGIRFVEVGLPDRYAGAGLRDAEAWEIADAINDRTAAVFYVADRFARPRLSEVIAVAHAAGVPVIVDAAAQLPPQINLRRFIEQGADLVAFSGGKAINGPQATGILCGRRDLVMAAALQHLDFDILWDQWSPPPTLIDKLQLKGVPHHGIGRICKVGKEQIVGLLTALELFVAEGDAARHARWKAMVDDLAAGLDGLPGCTVRLDGSDNYEEVPTVTLALSRASSLSALELVAALHNGTPSIAADPSLCDHGLVILNPICLQPGEPEQIAAAIRRLLFKS